MQEPYKYPIKDKSIRIFKIVTTEDLEGFNSQYKQYITQHNINAYINSSVSADMDDNGRTTFQRYITAVINRRNIDETMFIEFKGKTYQIQSVDYLEFYNTEISIRAKMVANIDLEVLPNE